MNKAIVLGATGYVGSAVIKKLIDKNISVLAIGRKSINKASELLPLKCEIINYLQLESSDISKLSESEKWKIWTSEGETVFYNFSWSGVERLTDGNMNDQFKNISYATEAVKTAKKLGCIKYINVGSQEEILFDDYLKNDWKDKSYNKSSINYAGAKLVTRDMSMLIAYLEKIDYINTRFSAVIDVNLTASGYITNSLKKIKNGESIEAVQNKQLFDIIDLNDLSNAYVEIGFKGKNKSDYYIGSNNPMPLSEYFSIFIKYKNNEKCTYKFKKRNISYFSSEKLLKDTGFKIEKEFNKLAMEIHNK